jgi:ADP-heptose:LPS heptosyltransferase
VIIVLRATGIGDLCAAIQALRAVHRCREPAARTIALAGGLPVGATVLHPGAKAPNRRWPVPRFAEAARALVAGGHKVVITGSTDDLAREWAAAAVPTWGVARWP